MKSIRMTCKNCTHRKPFFKSGGCDIKGKRSKHPEECDGFTPDPEKWEIEGADDNDVVLKAIVILSVMNAIAIITRVAIAFK